MPYKLETNKYRTSSSVTGLSGPCRLRCESKGRSRSRTSRLLRERTCKKIMEQQSSEVASANPCAASGDSVPVTAPIIASLDAAPTNTGDSLNRGMGVREKKRKTFSPVADEVLDDGRETF
ncbi:hypothetical protein PF008_g13730 [Phytophthora fragariae]|uniref:Uncharacterized protein n=1 Tax=Phytophthora fragariae TaxID=53985 RepID=A0A6G0RJ73_9STRA|nr:hypothetical protein PF008_g13730 [Phytophthora fragariae]